MNNYIKYTGFIRASSSTSLLQALCSALGGYCWGGSGGVSLQSNMPKLSLTTHRPTFFLLNNLRNKGSERMGETMR